VDLEWCYDASTGILVLNRKVAAAAEVDGFEREYERALDVCKARIEGAVAERTAAEKAQGMIDENTQSTVGENTQSTVPENAQPTVPDPTHRAADESAFGLITWSWAAPRPPAKRPKIWEDWEDADDAEPAQPAIADPA
jgi:hypothetical protein